MCVICTVDSLGVPGLGELEVVMTSDISWFLPVLSSRRKRSYAASHVRNIAMIAGDCKGFCHLQCSERGRPRRNDENRDEPRVDVEHHDEQQANRLVVLEGSPLGTPTAKSFATIEEAEPFIIERIRANVSPKLRDRFEKALVDKVVSEDGIAAVSEVIAGKLSFIRALATSYAPKIAIASRRYDDEDDAQR
jgi:hypothetical protein